MVTEELIEVLDEVQRERVKQDRKWGQQNHVGAHWLAILMEEVGEAAQCVCKADIPPVSHDTSVWRQGLRDELIQVAAVAVAWIEAHDRASR